MVAGMDGPESDEGVRGDLLSCYVTAAVAVLAAHGVDQTLAVGGQMFLGLRRDGDVLEFLHYHTPLAGNGDLYRIDLHRRGAADAGTAAEAIASEAERTGIALVTGAIGTLPWCDRNDGSSAPHWFVIRPAADGAAMLDIDDRFAWIDEYGEHPGFRGPVAAEKIGEFAYSPPPADAEQVSRERWALGDRRDRPDWSGQRSWQWLESSSRTTGSAPAAELGRTVLERTVLGIPTDAAVAAESWVTGRAAFDEMANMLDARLADPDAYRCQTDLWVALRNRQFFAVALRRAQSVGVADGLGEVGDWVEEHLVPAWSGLVRAMRYNMLRVAQGVRPHTSAPQELRRIGALEDEARDRVATALAGR